MERALIPILMLGSKLFLKVISKRQTKILLTFFAENEGVLLEEFIYLAFTRTPGGLIVGDSGLCCCVPCLSSAIVSFCL